MGVRATDGVRCWYWFCCCCCRGGCLFGGVAPQGPRGAGRYAPRTARGEWPRGAPPKAGRPAACRVGLPCNGHRPVRGNPDDGTEEGATAPPPLQAVPDGTERTCEYRTERTRRRARPRRELFRGDGRCRQRAAGKPGWRRGTRRNWRVSTDAPYHMPLVSAEAQRERNPRLTRGEGD